MSESDESGRRRRLNHETAELRKFDEDVSELREFYNNFDIEERSQFRAWLEQVASLATEGYQQSVLLRIRTQYDVCDENGETLRWGDVEFSPGSMLAAIKAWDAGEDFAPESWPWP